MHSDIKIMKKKYAVIIRVCLIAIMTIATILLPLCMFSMGDSYAENPTNPYRELKVPVSIEKFAGQYFITDSYHGQVICSNSPSAPLNKWKVMAAGLSIPHGIAYDGKNYVILDTENNQVIVSRKLGDTFQKVQYLENIGIRPHDIYYDVAEKAFYVWSSMTGQMYILKASGADGKLAVSEIRALPELMNRYVRSFYVLGEYILFPSGVDTGYLMLVEKKNFKVAWRIPVTSDIAGMADIAIIGAYFYLTVSTDSSGDQKQAKIIRTTDLTSLARGKYEDVSSWFPDLGVPYYFTNIEGQYYMTASGKASLYRFKGETNKLNNIEVIY